jgi:hypothetical protein
VFGTRSAGCDEAVMTLPYQMSKRTRGPGEAREKGQGQAIATAAAAGVAIALVLTALSAVVPGFKVGWKRPRAFQ